MIREHIGDAFDQVAPIGDFTTAQSRQFKRLLGGRFECLRCGDWTLDPIEHSGSGSCFPPNSICEVRLCQQPVRGVEALLFGKAGGTTWTAHAHCYLPTQGRGIVWLW